MICVFIIEDEEFYCEVIVFMLCKEGFEVNIVVNGVDGFEIYLYNGVDIVLFDFMMLGFLGIEVCC